MFQELDAMAIYNVQGGGGSVSLGPRVRLKKDKTSEDLWWKYKMSKK